MEWEAEAEAAEVAREARQKRRRQSRQNDLRLANCPGPPVAVKRP